MSQTAPQNFLVFSEIYHRNGLDLVSLGGNVYAQHVLIELGLTFLTLNYIEKVFACF